jgi:hypothetical protein
MYSAGASDAAGPARPFQRIRPGAEHQRYRAVDTRRAGRQERVPSSMATKSSIGVAEASTILQPLEKD